MNRQRQQPWRKRREGRCSRLPGAPRFHLALADVDDVLIGAAVSVLTGVGLWALLPRGVVLTRRVRTRDVAGFPIHDAWELQNDSPLPVRIISVTTEGIHTFDPDTERIREVEVPTEPSEDFGVSLRFDDQTLEIARTERGLPWRSLVVPPGDRLQAIVTNNRTVRVRYRRAGMLGVLERRQVELHGGA